MTNWATVGSRKRVVVGDRLADVTASYRWDGGAWVSVTTHDRNVDTAPPPPPPPPPPDNFPPGLIPNRAIAGWYAAKDSHNNDPAHAAVIMDSRNDSIAPGAWWQGSSDFGVTIPSTAPHRKYTPVMKQFHSGGFISPSALLANLAIADAQGYYLCQTTKGPIAPGGRVKDANGNDVNDFDWKGVSQGDYDTTLAAFAQIALDRIAHNKRGFFLTIHHEPNGDYTTSRSTLPTPTATPALWAAMQKYCSYYMAGRRGGTSTSTYVAANDTRANLSWGCIPNGFMITGTTALKDQLDVLMPASLITAFNANHGIISPDIYDDPQGQTGKRLQDKINAWGVWCRARGVNHAGITETGAYTKASIKAAWEAVVANKDVFRYCIYWDSGIGAVPQGATDWRLLPNGYPADSKAGASGPFVGPGTAVTEELLLYWRDVAVVASEAMV